MYSESTTNQQLSKVQEVLDFDLQYYPIDVIQQFKEEMDNLINLDLYKETQDKGKSQVKIEFKNQAAKKTFFSDKVQQIIKNEITMCQWDCWYWMERYYWISDITNKFILYSPLVPQQVWSRIFARLEELKRAILLLCLKARQTSMTTFAQGVVLQRLLFFPDVKALISSKSKPDTFKMSQMFLGALNRQPYWLRPFTTNFKSGEYYIFETGSYLDLGWGTQEALGRGATPTVGHLSEIASYDHPYEAIENALGKAMHETVWLLKILEGTAEGRGDWLHKKWFSTVEGHQSGISSLYPSFIPYAARLDIYPAPAWFEARKEFYTSWTPSTETIIHAKKVENYIKTNRDLREVMGSNWKMPRVQMFWYELSKAEAIKNNDLNGFLQECPSDPEEAFQHAGRTIYPIEVITHFSDSAQQKIPEVYKLYGDSSEINPTLFPTPDEVLEDGKKINIKSHYNQSIPSSNYQLIQVKFEGWDKFDPVNKILLWDTPNTRAIYGAGVDVSDGLGRDISDNAVLEIISKVTPERNARQVCEFTSPELQQANMWPFILSLCTYFSPLNQLLLTIEVNMGYELQNAMINHGWSNLFQSYDEGRLGANVSNAKFGIKTSTGNRDSLIGHFNSAVLGKWIDFYSMPLVAEIKDLKKVKSTSSILKIRKEKILGDVDDRVMATAICLYALDRDEILGHQKKSWESRRLHDEDLELKDLVDYNLGNDESLIYNYDSDNIEEGEVGSLFEDVTY